MDSKQLVKGIAVVALVLVSGASAWPQSTLAACNDKLIAGTYGFTIEGAKLAGPPNTPTGSQVGVAMAQFDGLGNFSQVDSVTINGYVVADFTHPAATGTYTVNSNCTGTYTINFTDGRPPATSNFVVVDNGNEIDSVALYVNGADGILATRSIGKRRFNRP